MKNITREWLNASQDDLTAARHLLNVQGLTNLVAFHTQQSLEKVLKALLEEKEIPNIKTHDLIRLYNLVKKFFIISDIETLLLINELYTDSRYPGDLGILPEGKPSIHEAKEFIEYAELIYTKIRDYLQYL